MKTPDLSETGSRHRLIAVTVALVAVVVLAGIGIYGLITGPNTGPSTDHRNGGETVRPGPVPAAPHNRLPATPQLPTVAASDDPETFARNVATTLFGWDTATGFMPLDYTSVIVDVGDPTGEEQAGLAADIAAYLPNREAWIELRQYSTAQHLSVADIYVPQAWGTAVEQAYRGQLVPGTIAYTIEGTRHRTGVWNGEDVTSEHPVAFTMFIVCAPAYETCHLLRLSQLDNPLR